MTEQRRYIAKMDRIEKVGGRRKESEKKSRTEVRIIGQRRKM
jgi:hypothetical protein